VKVGLKARGKWADRGVNVKTLSRHHSSNRASFSISGLAGGLLQNILDLPCGGPRSLPQVSLQELFAKQIQKLKTNPKSHIAGLFALVSFVSVLSCPNSAFALGFALPDQDAFATARGNAFAATADDPAAVFYNPAGISQLEGSHASVGAYGIVYGSKYNGPGGDIYSKTQLGILPQVFSSISLPKYNLTLGLGTYSPYGLRMEWPDNSKLAGIGQTGEMDYIRVNPVVAWQIIPSLSIAAGPTLNYSEAEFKLNPGFIDNIRGRDIDVGYTAGILWHPWEQHSFGVTYRSATDMNYQGHATLPPGPANIPISANFHFPQTVVAGYSFRPTTNWNFEVDANWTDWTHLQSVNVNPLPEAFAFDYHPSWMYDFGATRYLGHGWRLSGGFMYSENSAPDNTFNPLVPDSDRYIFSVGVGKQYKQFSWDVAYQLLWGPTRTVSNDGVNPGATGNYDFLGNAITINVGYHF
jgi:long-chain fatty acid transport protein